MARTGPPGGRGRRSCTKAGCAARIEPDLVSVSIDLGDEAPLSVDGESGDIDRRRISVQWFSGTILTGLCGAALMGGAVFASLDGEAHFAATAERFELAQRSGHNERSAARKADRLPTMSDATAAARQVIRISTTNRVGDRELVRVRPFTRIATNLALSTSELTANIPPFNPQRLLAGDNASSAAAEDVATGAAPEAEVSFVTRDLASLLPRLKIAATVPLDDVIDHVRDTANWTGNNGGPTAARYSVASLTPDTKLAYATTENPDDPYAGFQTRIVPENVTLLPKTASQTTGGINASERTITAKKGDSVGSILKDQGATPDEIKAITGLLGVKGREGGLRDGQKLRLLLANTGQRSQPVRLILIGDTAVEAVVALSDLGRYVSVDVQTADALIADNDDEDEDDGSGVRLYQSIYETALRNQIPRPVIDDLIHIYSYDVDFQRKVQPGELLRSPLFRR